MFKIGTVDNGWGVEDFERITKSLDADRVIMRKGMSNFSSQTTAEVIDYDPSLENLSDVDAFLFTKVGDVNFSDYQKIVQSGIPVVVYVRYHHGLIEHEKNGWHYEDDTWGQAWLMVAKEAERKDVSLSIIEEGDDCPLVSFITPTFNRDPKIVNRCINSVHLQTNCSWEHLICSHGKEELPVKALVNAADERTRYFFTGERRENDYGSYARNFVLDKALGDFIVFLEDDNIIHPDYLKTMTDRLLDDSDVDFAICRIAHFGPLNETVAGKPPQVLTGIPPKKYLIDTLQVMVKRDFAKEIGYQYSGYTSAGETFEKFAEQGTFVEVPAILGFHL